MFILTHTGIPQLYATLFSQSSLTNEQKNRFPSFFTTQNKLSTINMKKAKKSLYSRSSAFYTDQTAHVASFHGSPV